MLKKAESLLTPVKPAGNTDTGFLKLIAMITMVTDHAGKMFFSNYPVMRIIGRMAFPIYAYCIAMGMIYTHDKGKYLTRMLLIGLVSQPLYAIALDHTTESMLSVNFASNPLKACFGFYIYSWNKPSIMFTLICGIMLIWAIRDKNAVAAVAMCVFCVLVQDHIDYGIKGILLMVIFYIFAEHRLLSIICACALMVYWGTGGQYKILGSGYNTQIFAIASLPLIYIPSCTGLKLPKWLNYSFYPLHLAVITVVLILMHRFP